MKNISAIAIRNPMPVAVLFLVLAFGGVLGFRALPVTLSPDTSFPVAIITAADPGVAPADLVSAVAVPIENAVRPIAGVHHVLSNTTQGLTTVTVEFNIGVDPNAAVAAVRAAVAGAESELPSLLPPPGVALLETQGGPILTYAASDPELSALGLSRLVSDRVTASLSGLPGIARTEMIGGQQPEITIAADPARLAALGLTLPALDQQIHAAVDVPPAGAGLLGGNQAAIHTETAYQSPAALQSLPVALPAGESLPLGAVATIQAGTQPPESLARLDGAPVVGFSVWQSRGADALQTAAAAQAMLRTLQESHPGLAFTQVAGSVDDTRSTYHATLEALIEGVLLAAATVWWFLRDARATLIVALAMPLSLLPAFLVLSLCGQSLNAISLLALALVVGILVDDAIVEIENIDRHIAMGKRPYRAALDAADEIGPAVVATSFAIIAVFLPVSLMQGLVGQYFKPFGLTVAIAVFASLLVARLFTPLLAAYFLKLRIVHAQPGWLPAYRRWLDLALARPKSCLAMAAAVLALTVLLFQALPIGFLPIEDSNIARVSLTLPPGSSVTDNDRVAAQLSARLRAAAPLQADIGSIFTVSAQGVALAIRLRPERPDSRLVFEAKLRRVLDLVPDLDWQMSDNGEARDVELDFTGDGPAVLDAAMRRLASAASVLPGLSHVRTSLAPYATEITVTPKAALAATLGVNTTDLANTLVLATGTILPNAPTVSGAYGQTKLRIEVQGGADIAAMGQLPVPSASGTAPLGLVGALGFAPGPARITRADGTPLEGIGADLLPGRTLGQAVAELRGLPSYRDLQPQGISELDLGAAEFMQEMFRQFGFALGGGVLVLLGVMLLLFRNWLQPLTILAALPLSLAGGLLALLLCGFALDVSSAIGLLTLLGIVTKNAILIVDAALAGERAGLSRTQAARAAGLRRARPVVMTTLAMIAGMIPVTLVSGTGASLRLPMAVALIGGLLAATALSLVFVPVFYVRIGNLTDRLAPVLGRLLTTQPQDFR